MTQRGAFGRVSRGPPSPTTLQVVHQERLRDPALRRRSNRPRPPGRGTVLTPEAMEVNRMTLSDPYRTIIVEPARIPRPPDEQDEPVSDPEPEPVPEYAPEREPEPVEARGLLQ